MGNQRPRGVDQVGEALVGEDADAEALPRRVDVLPTDLEHAEAAAQGAHPVELLGRVAGGHVGDGADAVLGEDVEEFVEVRILEGLGGLVSGDGGLDVAEVGVAEDGADVVGEGRELEQRRAFVGGGQVDLRDEGGLEDVQDVEVVEGVGRVG